MGMCADTPSACVECRAYYDGIRKRIEDGPLNLVRIGDMDRAERRAKGIGRPRRKRRG